MQACITCGMPFVGEHANDIGVQTGDGPVCKFDSERGTVKSGEDIFVGGVNYFTDAVAAGDRELAIRLTRKHMKTLPYWQTHKFALLANGPEATDEEYQTAMAKLTD